jgi:hypothetical protein
LNREWSASSAILSLIRDPMKSTIKIRFTEPQIALVMRAHPNCNLDRLTELSFEFDQSGKIFDYIGTIKDGGRLIVVSSHTPAAAAYLRSKRSSGLPAGLGPVNMFNRQFGG